MTLLLERAPQAQPAIRRRFSIMATVDNRYLIVDDAGRPVPTVARPSRTRFGSALTTRSYESSTRSRTT
jgi:hypothetical protein